MDINKLERAGEKIEERLAEIRNRVGALPAEYFVDPVVIDISGGELQKLAETNPGKPIIINDKYHLAYIKDHTYHGYKFDHDSEVRNHPSDCFVRGNKVHFYHCTTIVHMKSIRKDDRYRATTQRNNIRIIDLRDEENVETRLAWCKHCITILAKEGKVKIWDMWRYKSRIAEYANARYLMGCVESCDQREQNAIQSTRDFFARTIEKK